MSLNTQVNTLYLDWDRYLKRLSLPRKAPLGGTIATGDNLVFEDERSQIHACKPCGYIRWVILLHIHTAFKTSHAGNFFVDNHWQRTSSARRKMVPVGLFVYIHIKLGATAEPDPSRDPRHFGPNTILLRREFSHCLSPIPIQWSGGGREVHQGDIPTYPA